MDLKNAETRGFALGVEAARKARKSLRREPRVPAKGYIRLAGGNYDLIDWSTSGFQAEGFGEDLEKGARYPIELNVDIDDETFFFECFAIIVRTSRQDRHFAGVFVEMNEEDRLAVYQYFEELEGE